ncbi:MAG: DUF4175 domain-containing protein [Bacteroidetes bacterium]|nr:DUF4175 domain-containing protein [Bacteroidota bacterium]MBU1721073.1 DUF4175 domain-containing protein [Bacteroidota bacterium]
MMNANREDNYSFLIRNLDAFIRKYYKNRLIRGGIYFVAAFVAFYLGLVLLESVSRFGTTPRTVLFYLYMLVNLLILVRLVFIPVLKIYSIGSIISHSQAAGIIGKHFPDISDKLLNTLQLKGIEEDPFYNSSRELIRASINQRTSELRPIPFTKAIDLTQNRKYLKFAVVPILTVVVLLFAAPSLIKDPTQRLIKFNTEFIEPAPFSFSVMNDSLSTIRQEDFVLQVQVEGNELPDQVFVVTENARYKLKKKSAAIFEYTFRNVNENIDFYINAQDVSSSEYSLKVLPKPSVLDFVVKLTYPSYLHRESESLNNSGDLVIPEGTQVSWSFRTRDTRELIMSIGGKTINPEKASENHFTVSAKAAESTVYSVVTTNDFVKGTDSLVYTMNVIPDAFPEIRVEEFTDSTSTRRLFFTGSIRDDYGFSRLSFRYNRINKDSAGSVPTEKANNLVLVPGLQEQTFNFFWDLAEMNLKPGEEIEYYFEVWDNDGVHGPKSAKSRSLIFRIPSLSEFDKQMEEKSEKLETKLDESLEMAKKLQKEIDDFNMRLMEKNRPGWEEKQKVEEIMNMQNELEKKIEEIRNENALKDQQQSEYYEYSERLMEKQEMLQELFEKIATDEMRKLMEEMQKLMEKFQQNKAQDLMEKMKLSNEDLEKELDRTMELFKQLEFEQKLEEAISKIRDLEKKQEELSKESENATNKDSEALKEKQDKLNEEFKEIRKDLDELEKKNNDLEKPNKMEKTDDQENKIQEDQQNSSEQLDSKKNKKASESQKNAAEKMDQLGNQMQEMYDKMQEESEEEDINALREILENVLKTSFDQEALMNKLEKTGTTDPKLPDIMKEQKMLKDIAKIIEDSLLALSKRQVALQSIINKEINAINMNMDKAIDYIANRTDPEKRQNFKQQAATRQQYAMTALNNLALLLSEVVEQMQAQQMQSNKNCSSSCSKPGKNKKPGSGKMSAATMRKMQQELNKQMEELEKSLKEGKMPGSAGQGRNTMSEQFAKIAAQQEAIRNQLQKMSQELKNDPNAKSGNLDKIAREMEQIETDLVNKKITQETLKRQKDILTRLLEAEKSEREREMEEKRESKEAKSENFGNPFDNFEYKKQNRTEEEILRAIPPDLKIFYKRKVNEYFHNFEE